MMIKLVTAYMKSDSEVLGELEKEYNKLRKPPRRQDLNIWLDQGNNLYERTNKGKYTKYTGLSALLDFVNAVKSVNPFFAQITHRELMQKDREGKELPKLTELTRDLAHELRFAKSTSGSDPTGFAATFQNRSTDQPSQDDKPQPPRGSRSNRKENRPCMCGDIHRFADCPYLFASNRQANWKPNPDTMVKVMDTLQNNASKRAAIDRIREANQGNNNSGNKDTKKGSNKGKGDKNKEQTDALNTESDTEQTTAIPSAFYAAFNVSMRIIHVDEHLTSVKDVILLDSGASVHIFNDRSCFITLNPLASPATVYAGISHVRVKGIGRV